MAVFFMASLANNVDRDMPPYYMYRGSGQMTYDPGVIKPPKLATLLEDPAFRRYMKVLPALPENMSHGKPWAVYVHTTDGRWLGGKFSTYRAAWSATVNAVRSDTTEDVSLVSRRRLFPVHTSIAHLMEYPYEWCVRCRRPSSFEQFTRHHAIPRTVPIDDAALRCVMCGMRSQNV